MDAGRGQQQAQTVALWVWAVLGSVVLLLVVGCIGLCLLGGIVGSRQ